MIEWTEDDVATANEEGWNIYDTQGSEDGDKQLQSNDEMELLESDIEAIRFVYREAIKGSEFHRKALAYLAFHNPKELTSFVEYENNIFK